jgi:hypothetical protein
MNYRTISLKLIRVIVAHILTMSRKILSKRRKIRAMKNNRKVTMRKNRLSGLIFQYMMFLNGLIFGTMGSFNSRKTNILLERVNVQLRESG